MVYHVNNILGQCPHEDIVLLERKTKELAFLCLEPTLSTKKRFAKLGTGLTFCRHKTIYKLSIVYLHFEYGP